jgi:hypothetical protein
MPFETTRYFGILPEYSITFSLKDTSNQGSSALPESSTKDDGAK